MVDVIISLREIESIVKNQTLLIIDVIEKNLKDSKHKKELRMRRSDLNMLPTDKLCEIFYNSIISNDLKEFSRDKLTNFIIKTIKVNLSEEECNEVKRIMDDISEDDKDYICLYAQKIITYTLMHKINHDAEII
jgi:hypothetical protein